VLKTIYNFHQEGSPHGPLMQGSDGALYGTTAAGGTGGRRGGFPGHGLAGVYKVLINFSTGTSANGSTSFAGRGSG